MTTQKKLLSVVSGGGIVLLLVILVFVSFHAYQLSQKNIFHRNRMIELEYLRRIVNDSHCTIQFFTITWGDKFYKQGNSYILDASTVFTDPYFEMNQYKPNQSDFFGYEFQFNPSGYLIGFYLYKP